MQSYTTNDIENFIQIGLLWDQVSGTDIDLQCVLLNEIGQIEDAVYYNELESKVADIKHSGDSLGESDYFDEVININLSSTQFMVKYIAVLICSYKGQPLTSVESCSLQVLTSKSPFTNSKDSGSDKAKTILEMLAGGQKHRGNSILAGIFEKSFEGKWRIVKVEEVGEGRNFLENESLIKKGLVKGLGFDEVLFSECKNWSGGKSFALDKNCSLLIPPVIKTIAVGLGWDSRCDIDSSILLFDAKGNCLENIFFANKISSNGSVVHAGDNTSGQGEGDDEVIKINLNDIPPQVLSIWAVITIYSQGQQFDDVNGAYCRLFCLPSDSNAQIAGSQFCRYNLSENQDNISNGNIMCSITRAHDGCWSVSPKGFYTKGTHTSEAIKPIISDVMKNNFSQVMTIDQIYEKFPKLKQAAVEKAQETARLRAQKEEQDREERKRQELIEKQRKEMEPKTVEFEVASASGLGSFDNNGLSDPYVVIYFNKKKIGKTQVVKKSLNPTWNYKTTLQIVVGDALRFEIWDRDRFFDQFMGASFLTFPHSAVTQALNLPVLDKTEAPSQKFIGTLSIKTKLLS